MALWVADSLSPELSCGHLATPFLSPFLSMVTTLYLLLSFSFFYLTLFSFCLFSLPLFYSVSSFSFCAFVLIPNFYLSSWVDWPKTRSLYSRHSKTRSLEKADEGPQHWMLGYFGDYLPSGWSIQGECVDNLLCASCGTGQCQNLDRNIIHVWCCPHSSSTLCFLTPLLWADVLVRVESSPTTGIFSSF